MSEHRIVMGALVVLLGCQSPIVGAACRDGLSICGGACVDTDSDPDHCGGCGIACEDEQACRYGVCVVAGDGGLEDAAHGEADASAADAGRDAGVVSPRDAGPADGGAPSGCDVGELRCVDECVRPGSDPSHCGGCGVECAAGEVCSAGRCADACSAPSGICDGRCVDHRSHPDHCGACGTRCASGVCSGGVCRGPTAGHVVVVGHSYEESRPLMNRVAGNAVFLARTSPARVTVYEGDATTAGIAGTDAAIGQVATETGRSWTRATASADGVPLALASSDVFVVYAQTDALDEDIIDLGERWGTALTTFLGTGGIVVVFDGAGRNTGTHRVLEATGLMSSTGTVDVSRRVVDVVSPGDAVALGVPLRYRAEASSVRIGSRDGATVVSDGAGPVVLHSVVLP